jgi:hypothetical protein
VPIQLGVKQLWMLYRRFSIAWTRIIPGGVAGSAVNMAGINWYRTFIQALLEAGIRPAVTMYHWVGRENASCFSASLQPQQQDAEYAVPVCGVVCRSCTVGRASSMRSCDAG